MRTIALSFLIYLVSSQAGAGSPSPNSNPFAGYSCDPSICKLPKCSCATMNPPVSNPPQFLVLTFDDAQQSTLLPQVNSLLNRKNKNGCPVTATWYTQVLYTNPILVTQWYASGNEVGDHSVTHAPPFAGNYSELEGNRAWMTNFAGVPRGKIKVILKFNSGRSLPFPKLLCRLH